MLEFEFRDNPISLRTMAFHHPAPVVLDARVSFFSWQPPWFNPREYVDMSIDERLRRQAASAAMPVHQIDLSTGTRVLLNGVLISGGLVIIASAPNPESNEAHPVLGGYLSAAQLIYAGHSADVRRALEAHCSPSHQYKAYWSLFEQEIETLGRIVCGIDIPPMDGEEYYVGTRSGYALVGRERVSDRVF